MPPELVLTDAEVQIIYMIRTLGLFDKLEIRHTKSQELTWYLIKSHQGRFDIQEHLLNT